MRNLLLTLRYDGSAYHGWQVQENAVTVQQTLQDAIEAVFGDRLPVTGCSRTDAGVHAKMFCVNFRTDSALACDRIPYALNAHLPDDIGVYACRQVPDDFHARYSCVSKQYVYVIRNSPFRDPFAVGRAATVRWPLDEDMLHREAQAFCGTHDFAAFAAAGGSVEDTVRTVHEARVRRDGETVCFEVRADGFLYNMVRIMVGTLLDVASGKLPQGSIPEILRSLDRSRAGVTAPPQGLYLQSVQYDLRDVE
jgi:tRNA pseudouridine38-40 synthase